MSSNSYTTNWVARESTSDLCKKMAADIVYDPELLCCSENCICSVPHVGGKPGLHEEAIRAKASVDLTTWLPKPEASS